MEKVSSFIQTASVTLTKKFVLFPIDEPILWHFYKFKLLDYHDDLNQSANQIMLLDMDFEDWLGIYHSVTLAVRSHNELKIGDLFTLWDSNCSTEFVMILGYMNIKNIQYFEYWSTLWQGIREKSKKSEVELDRIGGAEIGSQKLRNWLESNVLDSKNTYQYRLIALSIYLSRQYLLARLIIQNIFPSSSQALSAKSQLIFIFNKIWNEQLIMIQVIQYMLSRFPGNLSTKKILNLIDSGLNLPFDLNSGYPPDSAEKVSMQLKQEIGVLRNHFLMIFSVRLTQENQNLENQKLIVSDVNSIVWGFKSLSTILSELPIKKRSESQDGTNKSENREMIFNGDF